MKQLILLTLALANLILPLIAFAQSNTFPTTGNVGIGISSPSNSLQVANQNGSHTLLGGMHFFGTTSGSGGDNNGISTGGYYNGAGMVSTQSAFVLYQQAGGSHFFIGETGLTSGITISPRLIMKMDGSNGNIGIGTGYGIPSEKLSVNGKIRAHEVKVEINNWPDYVFETDYNLWSLTDLKRYIGKNKHLPEMPSSDEIRETGLDLGVMNAKLLQKIEELTLHVIRLSDELEKVKTHLN